MKHAARMLAIVGLVLAIVVFARADIRGIVELLIAAGPGLALAVLFHVVPMVANGRALQRLLPAAQRPGARVMACTIWIREAVNGLLPVARIGGEVVAFRVLRRHVEDRADIAASLVADMALSVLSQAVFALLGLALLVMRNEAHALSMQLTVGVLGLIPLGVGFVLVQRSGALGVVTRLLDRLSAGRLGFALAHSLRFDEALRRTYQRHRDVAASFGWQLAGWVLASTEIWLALLFLGHPVGIFDAIAIEALIQAVSSAAFVVPGALGVQEGAFIVIGGAVGLDATTALALATVRRLRDALVFIPGLLAWQWLEAHARHAVAPRAGESETA